jgi:hypothetical protein
LFFIRTLECAFAAGREVLEPFAHQTLAKFNLLLRSNGRHIRCVDGSNAGDSWRTVAQPSRCQPGTRHRELRPAAIKADKNVWRRIHGWMTERTGPIAIEPYFGRNDGESLGFAFWAGHNTPLGKDVYKNRKSNKKSVENQM